MFYCAALQYKVGIFINFVGILFNDSSLCLLIKIVRKHVVKVQTSNFEINHLFKWTVAKTEENLTQNTGLMFKQKFRI